MLILQILISIISATTVSYRLPAHEQACFYAEVKQVGEKLGFYFAVQQGGKFDVDFEVHDSEAHQILSGIAQRQGDYAFTAKIVGEYTFCFSNSMSTFVEKLIDFDISVQHELQDTYFKSELELSVGKTSAKTDDALEKSFASLQRSFGGSIVHSVGFISRLQREIRVNEHRNYSVVQDSESRMMWFAILDCVVIVAIAIAQVYLIQTFFFKKSRMRV